MLGRFMDWVDEVTGYDRTGARVLLFIVAINLVFVGILVWPWADRQIFGPDCDSECQAGVERFMDDHPTPTPATFNPEEFIRDNLNDP